MICDNTDLREAFALFDADRQEEITVPELGKVRESQRLLQLEAGNLASRTSKNCISSLCDIVRDSFQSCEQGMRGRNFRT